MYYRQKSALVILASGIILTACGKSDTTASHNGQVGQADDLGDLKLSSALQVALPKSLEKAGGAKAAAPKFNLADSKKSSEACEAVQAIDEALADARSTGAFLCHLEVEKISFGKKMNITIQHPDGPDSKDVDIQMWVDNSDPANLKVYLCEDRKVYNKFSVSGFGGEGLIKGNSLFSSDYSDTNPETGQTSSGVFSMVTEFDFTTQGVKNVKSSSKTTNASGDYQSSFLTFAEMNLLDTGVSSLFVSKSGTYSYGGQPGTWDEQAAVLFNGVFGQALSKSSGLLTRATFNGDGYVVAASQAPSEVIVDRAKLPEKLPTTFSPEAPAGWDCVTTESLTVDAEAADKKAAHDACEIAWPEYNSCSDSNIFAPGTPE